VRGIDPTTGQYFDDTKRYIDAAKISEDEKNSIFSTNARAVFHRLNQKLEAQGR
jgi:4-oxalmesaconate hydratase